MRTSTAASIRAAINLGAVDFMKSTVRDHIVSRGVALSWSFGRALGVRIWRRNAFPCLKMGSTGALTPVARTSFALRAGKGTANAMVVLQMCSKY